MVGVQCMCEWLNESSSHSVYKSVNLDDTYVGFIFVLAHLFPVYIQYSSAWGNKAPLSLRKKDKGRINASNIFKDLVWHCLWGAKMILSFFCLSFLLPFLFFCVVFCLWLEPGAQTVLHVSAHLTDWLSQPSGQDGHISVPAKWQDPITCLEQP